VLDIQGVVIQDIPAAIREIITVHTSQPHLDKLTITVSAYDSAGKLMNHLNSKDENDLWASFVDVCGAKSITSYDPVSTTIAGRKYPRRENPTKDLHLTMQFLNVKIPTKKSLPNFPRWGTTSVAAVFADVFGFYIPIPLHEALNKAPHGASQNGRIAIVKPQGDVDSRPTPASTRTSFVQTCEIYQAVLEKLQSLKPSGWDQYQKDKSVSPPPRVAPVVVPTHAAEEEKWVPTAHGLSIQWESERKEGEEDKEYIERVKRNQYSRKSKAKKRRASADTPPSVETAEPEPVLRVQIPELPSSPVADADPLPSQLTTALKAALDALTTVPPTPESELLMKHIQEYIARV
jgi:hypothetical protein